MTEPQDRDDGVWKCSICGHLFNRDEIILEHELSPICDSCFNDHEQLGAEDMPVDDIRDSRKEIRELQELERRDL